MRKLALSAAVAALALPFAVHAEARNHPECARILPPTSLPAGTRSLVPEDLVRLRDIGLAEPQNFPDPAFTLSPDGRWAAFQLRQGDPASNRYCFAMMVFDLSGRASPRIIDEGGEPIQVTIDLRGIANLPLGLVRIITPRWSGDGKWIAYLKRIEGTTQVWRANADGSGSGPLTHSNVDVVDFRIGKDGASVIYATRPGVEQQRRDNAAEGLNGWHYDDRFAPWIAKAPLPLASAQRQVQVLDAADEKVRAASAAEIAMVNASETFGFADPADAANSSGIEIRGIDVFGRAELGALRAKLGDGSSAVCNAAACEGARHPWWMPGKNHIRFSRPEGWGGASTAIYDWDLKTGAVRQLYLTDDLLEGCAPQDRDLICLAYSSLVPGQFVRLDPSTGKREILFDPNPELRHLTLGRPIRLHWRNAFGVESLADLVLPIDYRQGRKYPMVVVQYDTRGFLRGGTDDEYPIQAFANRGYAVLSFKRPQILAISRAAKTFDEIGNIDLKDFADRRSVESSLEGGVHLAIERGIADPAHIGITGLSDGTSTVEWALIHSSLFSAAAVSSCCWDPAFEAHIGEASARHFQAEGWPNVLEFADPFWKQVSLFANARRISTPILVSASDEELLGATLSYAGLREAGVPIDMFVYPGEYHARWQPAHRLANYTRSLDWFDFWLRGIRSGELARQVELREWDRLRKEGNHGRPI